MFPTLKDLLSNNIAEHRRRVGAEAEKNSEPLPLENDNDDSDPKQEDDDLSGSEDVEPDSPVS